MALFNWAGLDFAFYHPLSQGKSEPKVQPFQRVPPPTPQPVREEFELTINSARKPSKTITINIPNSIHCLKHLALALSAALGLRAGNAHAVPGPPVAGYARWFDASVLGLADSAPVTQWNDGSSSGANATVPSGNAAPVYIANSGTENGLGAIMPATSTRPR